ncbi:MAG: histidine phosphatase family protein [Alphaproteobacteria bacterium]|nr:histidine phosphatase family protein [Alphaproteobacteria bacterium]
MKTLLILRHAKSSWDDDLPDKDRPLAKRGHAAAPAMGRYIAQQGYEPDLILCSTARRTLETLDLVMPALGRRVSVLYEEPLYLAEAKSLLERVRWVEDTVETVMIVGHNPGLEELALLLCGMPIEPAERERIAAIKEKFPTAALAVFTFAAKHWRTIGPGRGRLVDFKRPRDL